MKSKKIITLVLMCLLLTGCTKSLTKNNEVVVNPTTGQSLTENILCKPTDKETIKIYEENKVDISKLPECKKFKANSGGYEGLWTSIFVKPLAWLIISIGNLVKNYGASLIIVSLLIRMVAYPFTKKTAMQSELLKQANPELDKLEKKYENKTDQESLMKKNQEMMIIYKKYNINPVSGCLFSFIQLPLFIGFLEAINRVPAIFEETFLGFQMGTTPFIALKNGEFLYLILIVLIIATTYFSFKMNKSTATTSPEMQKQNNMMMWFMVVFIGFMSFQLSSAIAIYWIVSSGFTIFQNIITDVLSKRKK